MLNKGTNICQVGSMTRVCWQVAQTLGRENGTDKSWPWEPAIWGRDKKEGYLVGVVRNKVAEAMGGSQIPHPQKSQTLIISYILHNWSQWGKEEATEICSWLQSDNWTPNHGLKICLLLKRGFGDRKAQTSLGGSLSQKPGCSQHLPTPCSGTLCPCPNLLL
jgi:hypothetical protein